MKRIRAKTRLDKIIRWIDKQMESTRSYDGIITDAQRKLQSLSDDMKPVKPLHTSPFTGPWASEMRAIIRMCESKYNVTFALIVSKRRYKEVVKARYAAMYIQREVLPLGWKEIAAYWGKPHPTCILQHQNAEIRMSENLQYADDIEDMKSRAVALVKSRLGEGVEVTQ